METRKEEKKCLRCLYTWMPLVENPVQCPRCKSTCWEIERQERYNKWQKIQREKEKQK
ncbi:MAG: hypothetical protein DDT22_01042 [candidate division WS2 bacterium]|nr:hypothetical protein [Candidatus Lithacetigena glycinireducens]